MTPLEQATVAAGVFVEFVGQSGHTLGQALVDDWADRKIPTLGQQLTCPAAAVGGFSRTELSGTVVDRRFEVQTDDEGQPSLWVYLLVRADNRTPRPTDDLALAGCSA